MSIFPYLRTIGYGAGCYNMAANWGISHSHYSGFALVRMFINAEVDGVMQ